MVVGTGTRSLSVSAYLPRMIRVAVVGPQLLYVLYDLETKYFLFVQTEAVEVGVARVAVR